MREYPGSKNLNFNRLDPFFIISNYIISVLP
jgi:hypothetical protein